MDADGLTVYYMGTSVGHIGSNHILQLLWIHLLTSLNLLFLSENDSALRKDLAQGLCYG